MRSGTINVRGLTSVSVRSDVYFESASYRLGSEWFYKAKMVRIISSPDASWTIPASVVVSAGGAVVVVSTGFSVPSVMDSKFEIFFTLRKTSWRPGIKKSVMTSVEFQLNSPLSIGKHKSYQLCNFEHKVMLRRISKDWEDHRPSNRLDLKNIVESFSQSNVETTVVPKLNNVRWFYDYQ